MTRFTLRLLIPLLLLPLSGCVFLTERAGQIIDGSAFSERIIAVYKGPGLEIREMRNRNGEHSLVIVPKSFPSVHIRATAPDESGVFLLVSLDYIGGNEHGWNEFRLDLFGSGTFASDEKGAQFFVFPGIEPVQISSGRIRRYDTRITGEEALTYLRNRHERILALTEWMSSRESGPQGWGVNYFGSYWQRILFPELVRRRQRPPDWEQDSDRRVRAENVSWNIGYTERVFPQELQSVRNSGTMLRDWEEALEWIHLMYEWDALTETLLQETALARR